MEVTLKAKFDIGDEVFFRSHGEIACGTVTHLQAIYVKTESGSIYLGATYRLKDSRGELYREDFWEKRLHSTREELE